ncbi:hypothetical protein Ancab_040584 [Ancistrocladus abbreviatus]
MALFLAFFFMLLASAAAYNCTNCVHHSKTKYFADEGIPYGACGYGHSAESFNGKKVAGALTSIYKNGARCGACFQIRCRNEDLCTQTGTKVIVTDHIQDKTTDLMLSKTAFKAMAKDGKGQELIARGVVDVQYKRIPCDFKKHNLSLRVEESSNYPNHLAVKVLYQGGQTDMVVIEVAKVGSPTWTSLSHNYGAIWSSNTVPKGPLQIKFGITSGYNKKYIIAKNPLPTNWKKGVIYDTGVQIKDISQYSCDPPCDNIHWN